MKQNAVKQLAVGTLYRIKQTYKTQSRVIKTLTDVLDLDDDDCPGCFTDENSKSCFKINNKYLMYLKNSRPKVFMIKKQTIKTQKIFLIAPKNFLFYYIYYYFL